MAVAADPTAAAKAAAAAAVGKDKNTSIANRTGCIKQEKTKNISIVTVEQIEKFFNNASDNVAGPVKISFKTRNTVEGVFVRASDFTELRGKNFWRIVTVKYLDEYKNSSDLNFSRIFNGAEFTRLSLK